MMISDIFQFALIFVYLIWHVSWEFRFFGSFVVVTLSVNLTVLLLSLMLSISISGLLAVMLAFEFISPLCMPTRSALLMVLLKSAAYGKSFILM